MVGAFPDGQSCLDLAAARLRHVAGTQGSIRKYMDMVPLHAAKNEAYGARKAPQQLDEFYIWDRAPGRSIVESLAAEGHPVFIVSWRNRSEAAARSSAST